MRSRNGIISLAVAVLLIVSVVVFYLKGDKPVGVKPVLAGDITLEATMSDAAGIDVASQFVLRANADAGLTVKSVQEGLSVEPHFEFTVKGGAGGKEILITPDKPLAAKEIYRFALNMDGTPLRWAFQTKGEFKIISTLPRDKSAGVPVDTGIEITFSHINFEDLTPYFEIVPHAEGRFEVHKKTAVFVPKEPLKPSTIYTVTLKKGLKLVGSDEAIPQDLVFQFETREADGSDARPYEALYIYKKTVEFTTAEAPTVPLGYYAGRQGTALPEVEAEVYKYKSAAEFIKALQQREETPSWASRTRGMYLEDISPLTKVASFSSKLIQVQHETYLQFPEPLPAGYYIAQLKFKDWAGQLWLQISDLGVYAVYAENQTLIWVNDLINGRPVQGAQVSLFESSNSSHTDEKGLARLAEADGDFRGAYLIVSKGSMETVASAFPDYYGIMEWQGQRAIAQLYWNYFYLDRGLYKPEDTVYFWGFLKPRQPGQDSLDNLSVTLTRWGWRGEVAIDSTPIKMDDYTFTGSIQLPNLSPGYYYLTVKQGDNTITSQGFEVETYTKPAYQLEIVPSKKAIHVGETMEFNIKATFFEGTGAANIPLNYHLDMTSSTVTTDFDGNAKVVYTPQYQRVISYPVTSKYMHLHASLPESGDIYSSSHVIVLNNDISIEAQGEVSGATGKVDISLNKLNAARADNDEFDGWYIKALQDGPAPNHQVDIVVYKDIWEKKEAGEYYDFINKKVQKRYTYFNRRELVTEGAVFTDAGGKAEFSFDAEEKEAYWIKLSAVDYRGNLAVSEIHVRGKWFYIEYDYNWYYLNYQNQKYRFKIGETVSLVMKNNENDVLPRENGFLFITSREGLLSSQVQDNGTFSTVFKEELIPNFWVRVVYFDGRFYRDTYDHVVPYDEQERALDIKVSLDKDEYRPKDTVNVDIEVKDKTGKPMVARVNLNLVDEALYALRDQHADVLGTLYRNYIRSGIYKTISTHVDQSLYGGGAEQGGEGDSERKDFKDAVFFETVSTDSSGKAKVSFTVPDNLTAWRLTYQAVTGNLHAGSGTAKVIVKLPFFVDAIVGDTYLTGDKPVIPIRSFGSGLKGGSAVSFSVKLKSDSDGIVFEQNLTAKAFETSNLQLPALEIGHYKLSITGKTKEDLQDTLVLPVNVVNTIMTRKRTDFYFLEDKTRIIGADNAPTMLTFVDYERSQYLNLLWSLAWVGGSRIEQKLAPMVSREMLKKYFPDLQDFWDEEQAVLSSYQTHNGGIAILPYADDDLELSVKIAGLYQEAFDTALLAEYFYRIADDPEETRERGITALYGLAALGEPVLQEVMVVLGQEGLNVNERLYLILALIELGDEQRAAVYLQELLKAHGETAGKYMRINTGSDQDDILDATALAALAAATVNYEESYKLQQYVLENYTKDILVYLQQLMFLNKALPRMPKEEASFSYYLDGKEQKVSLQAGKTFTLLLTPAKLETLRFGGISGRVGVTAAYEAPFDPGEFPGSDEVKITRSYSVARGKSDGTIKANDLIQVKITYQFSDKAPAGVYEIVDFLPAGLKIVPRPYIRGISYDRMLGYPVEIRGQKAVFLVGKNNSSFHYYARVVNAGDFSAEGAIISHAKSGKIYGITKTDRVSIK